MSILPNFLVIGAFKSGTTSLQHYLPQHPDVFMCPQRETQFWALKDTRPRYAGPRGADINRLAVTSLDQYAAYFEGATQKRIGEICPLYLYHPAAPGNIAETLPDAKLVVVLRNPVDRAFSQYTFLRQIGVEPAETFEAALALEAERKAARWLWSFQYRDLGCYGAQLARYYARFDPAQIQVYRFAQFRQDAAGVVQQMFGFLDLPPAPVDVAERHNVSGVPRVPWVGPAVQEARRVLGGQRWVRRLTSPAQRRRWVSVLKQWNNKKIHLHPDTRAQLQAHFRPDILRLQDLIDQDLSAWLSA